MSKQEIRFYRTVGERFCRITAKPADNIDWSLQERDRFWNITIVGDYIPTETRQVSEFDLYPLAGRILSEWAEIAVERRRKQGLS